MCFYIQRQSHHVGVTTMEVLDHGSLHSLLEPARQTASAGIRTPAACTTGEHSKSYLDSLIITIRNMRPLHFLPFSYSTAKKRVCRGSGLIQSERDSGIGGITIPHTRLRNGHTADIIGMNIMQHFRPVEEYILY
jgi:hypothetical protein